MAERLSALHGHYPVGRLGDVEETGVWLREVPGLVLHQIAAWPDSMDEVAALAAQAAGTAGAPGPCQARDGERASLLRVEPLKWWLVGAPAPALPPGQGAVLDLSHSRTHLRIAGSAATLLLNRHLPLDLREASFGEGAVASTAFHHVGITLWRSAAGYELFLPRGYALSLWEMLLESAPQFGAEVVQ